VACARACSTAEILSGRLEFRCVAVENLVLAKGERRYDLAFAVRVGVLDGRYPAEGHVALARLRKALVKGGILLLDGGAPLKQVTLGAADVASQVGLIQALGVMRAKLVQLGEFESMSKVQARTLADALLAAEPNAVETCVRFVCAETVGLWHGRGRAMMCRRLKHVQLDQDQKKRLMDCIFRRLSTGRFSEQFRDQLRLALHLDVRGVFAAAKHALDSGKPHVQRYANWVLSHKELDNDVQPGAAGMRRK